MTLALARRYRPQNFSEVVGQEMVLKALSNALDEKQLHHAYLFTGTRGVGKTTIARLLAKSLNCEQGISSKPCGKCQSCQDFSQGAFIDLIEVDAASRTKVEDTRELLENVQYLPTRGRFKVYLIDEVHMLSTHSFNALLKTLEEPPEHVIFLLATTDPQKIPATILSRCLQFHLLQIPFAKITKHLSTVLEQEGAAFEPEGVKQLARAADGSLRDALSLLDQALAYGNRKIEAESVRTMLGISPREGLIALLEAIINGNVRALLSTIRDISKSAPDFSKLLDEILEMLHQLAIAKRVPEALEQSIESREQLLSLAKQTSDEEIQLFYQIGINGQKDLNYAPNPRIGFEMIALRMIAFQPVTVYDTPVREKAIVKEKPAETPTKSESVKPAEVVKSVVQPSDKTLTNWRSAISELNLSGLAKILAEHCTVEESTESTVRLKLDVRKNMLLNKRNQERLQEAISHYLGREIKLSISSGEVSETPAMVNEREQSQAKQAALEQVEKDSSIQGLIQAFGAKVEDISIDK